MADMEDTSSLVDSFVSYEDGGLINSSYKSFVGENGGYENGDVLVPVTHPDFESSFDRTNEMGVSWHNINVSVKPPKSKWNIFRKNTPDEEPKSVLKNVSGKVEPGELLAIMGASGAGKTTLMNVLTNRNLRSMIVTGVVKVNGFKAGSSLGKHSSYVQQDDIFIGTLTVKEHLTFQAMLRMDRKLKYKERMEKVEATIIELGLTKCAETVIGIPGEKKGVSGGERKRLAFASEVLTNPAVMFCDEPTSGLDSFMSMNVVSVLRKLASGGRTMICTIHQPSSEVYAMFDNLLLMAEGRVAFMGKRERAIPFFESMDLAVPRNYNPADFFVFNLAVIPGKEEKCRDQIARICEEFERSSGGNSLVTEDTEPEGPPSNEDKRNSSSYKASWFMQMRALSWRSFLTVRREPHLIKIRLFQTIAIGIILGLIYYNQKLNQKGVMNINGVMFLMITNMSFTSMFAVINVFCAELPIFLREHGNTMYRTDVYFICKTTCEIPFYTVLAILFTSIMYWMIGLKPEFVPFMLCVANIILIINVAASFGYMVSCVSNSVAMALSIGSPLVVPLMLFGGFFLNHGSISDYFDWIKYLSWFFYGYQIQAVNQWKNVTHIECDPGAPYCIPNGDAILHSLDFNEDNFLRNFLLLLVLFIFYRMLAFFFLLMKTFKKT